jgi:hypothetical protein
MPWTHPKPQRNGDVRFRCLCADLNYVQVVSDWMAQPLIRAASSTTARY